MDDLGLVIASRGHERDEREQAGAKLRGLGSYGTSMTGARENVASVWLGPIR